MSPIVSGGGSGGSQPSLPLDLGPGLFEINTHGATVVSPDDPAQLSLFAIEAPAGFTDSGNDYAWIQDENGNNVYLFEPYGLTINGLTGEGAGFVALHDPDSSGSVRMTANKLTVKPDPLTGEGGINVDAPDGSHRYFRAGEAGQLKVSPGTDVIEVTSDAKLGFYGQVATPQPTGVPVTAAAIHAALVALGLITA